jgi:hypothetical protein
MNNLLMKKKLHAVWIHWKIYTICWHIFCVFILQWNLFLGQSLDLWSQNPSRLVVLMVSHKLLKKTTCIVCTLIEFNMWMLCGRYFILKSIRKAFHRGWLKRRQWKKISADRCCTINYKKIRCWYILSMLIQNCAIWADFGNNVLFVFHFFLTDKSKWIPTIEVGSSLAIIWSKVNWTYKQIMTAFSFAILQD